MEATIRKGSKNIGNQQHKLPQSLAWFYLLVTPGRWLVQTDSIFASCDPQEAAGVKFLLCAGGRRRVASQGCDFPFATVNWSQIPRFALLVVGNDLEDSLCGRSDV